MALGAGAVGSMFVLAVMLAAPSVLGAVRGAGHGRAALRAAAASVAAGDAQHANASIASATAAFAGAVANIDSPWASPARHIPLVGRQLAAAGALARAGELAARAAHLGLGSLDPSAARLRNGRLDLAGLHRLRTAAASSIPVAQQALGVVERSPASWLFLPLSNARTKALTELSSAIDGTRRASIGLGAAPWLLGGGAPRRYLVLFANPAEARGTGGLWGLYTFVDADNGTIKIERAAGRPFADLPSLETARLRPPRWFADAWGPLGATKIWPNLNLSPDFPTVGALAVQAMSAKPVDGVIQIDPAGLAALLRVTGPASIPSWPAPIDASNVQRIAMHDVYERYPSAQAEGQRTQFGAEVVHAVFGRLLSSEFSLRGPILSSLSDAAAGGHVQMYATDAGTENVLKQIGIAGNLDRADDATDVVGVFANNSAGNKLDWYLRTDVTYDVRLDARTGVAHAHLTVVLRNDAPAQGLPDYVTGTNSAPGHNRVTLDVLRSPDDRLVDAKLNGSPAAISSDREGNLSAHHVTVSLPPGATARLGIDTIVPAAAGDTYRLRVLAGSVANAGKIHVVVEGAEPKVSLEGRMSRDVTVVARARQSWLGRLFGLVNGRFRGLATA